MPIKLRDTTVQVKLITKPEDIEYYSDILTRYHYLKSAEINCHTLLHVAKRCGEDIAILTWESGARKWFGLRDRVIGWTKEQKAERLKYTVENRRFLMLVQEKNLASKILSESVARLGKDANLLLGHEFMYAETFVDPSRGYEGTCYKAAGWTDAGMTQGGRGPEVRSKKRYFIKELSVHAVAKLKAPELTISDINKAKRSTLILDQIDFKSLKSKLDAVPDFRGPAGKYPLTSMFALIIVAVLCGETSAKGAWRWISSLSFPILRNLGCRDKPSYVTVWRALSKTDSKALEEALCEWLGAQNKKLYIDSKVRIMSLDGKKLRTASKISDADMYVLSLIDTISKTLVKQIPVGEKTNEIPVAQAMLAEQNLNASTIITADAMHTQKKLAQTIVKKTLTTSCPSKTTNQISEKPLSKTHQKKAGRFRTVLRNLPTGE